MLLVVLVCGLCLSAVGQQVENEWLDPYDMLNYDAGTKTMRKPAETVVANTRREYVEDSGQSELIVCNKQVVDLQQQIEDLKKKVTVISQQPTCNPVFKRFLSRLLKEIERLGMPSDSTDVLYDAKIKLSKQAMMEIQKLLEGEDRWRTGALDNAISQILVDLKPHDYEAWKWHFEDTFGVDLDTLLKMGMAVLIIMAIVCTQLWSTVSWFVQFKRLFVICFIVSIIWNWFYLYKIAFAEHQNNIVKMDSVNEKCTGVKKIDWSDSLKEWFRRTWTLQDDPCKRYYEVLMVNPILLVPPTKAISVTITTFITEPLKHFGQGISEFLRALLKDLPVTLQIPVLLTIVLSILVFMYGSVQAVFQHGILAPLRRPRRDPPPPELEHQQPRHLRIEDRDRYAGGDAPAPQQAPVQGHQRADDARNYVHQRRQRHEPVRVETVKPAHRYNSENETDGARREDRREERREEPHEDRLEDRREDRREERREEPREDRREERREERREPKQSVSADSDSENQQETEAELHGASAVANTTQSKTKPSQSDSSQSKNKDLKGNQKLSQDRTRRDGAADRTQPEERQQSNTNDQNYDASAEDGASFVILTDVETVGVPVQETSPASEE